MIYEEEKLFALNNLLSSLVKKYISFPFVPPMMVFALIQAL